MQLSFSTPQGKPISITPDPDPDKYVPFDVSLWLNVGSGVAVEGLGFYLEISPAPPVGSGYFHIDSISLPLNSILYTTAIYPGAASGEKPTADSLLTPRNGQYATFPEGHQLLFNDSGVGVTAGDSPEEVVQFRLRVSSNTPKGTYVLSTVNDPGTGWTDGNDEYEIPTLDHAHIQITVVPEPALMASVSVIGLLAFAGCRRLARRGIS